MIKNMIATYALKATDCFTALPKRKKASGNIGWKTRGSVIVAGIMASVPSPSEDVT
jgi:hypothetical protein